jgi:hypothetical protein
MTTERQDIMDGFYSGNTKRLRLTVTDSTGVPKDLTGAKITFVLFAEKTDVTYLFKSSTVVDAIAGYQITIDTPASGICTVHLWPKDTALFNGTFRYHINVVDNNDFEETVTTGRINIFKAFAKRPHNANQTAYLVGR